MTSERQIAPKAAASRPSPPGGSQLATCLATRALPFLLTGALAGCADTRPNVPLGTTTTQLQAKFGPPLYKAPAEKGRQLWFYNMTFAEVRKYRQIAPLTVDALGEVDPGGLEFVTAHSSESHAAALVVSPAGVVIDAPDAHVNPNR